MGKLQVGERSGGYGDVVVVRDGREEGLLTRVSAEGVT